jgi:hypothetical protein
MTDLNGAANFRSGGLACLLLALLAEPERVFAEDQGGELTEPIFTERSFIENNAELDSAFEEADDADSLGFSVEANWVFLDRLQLGVAVPFGVNFPKDGQTTAGFSDVEFSAQVLLCCESGWPLDFLSFRAEVAPPTGSRAKDIGGDGSFGFSVLAGRLFPLTESLPDLGIQVQAGYAQQIRLDDEQRETARELGLSRTREKDVIWNVALTQNYSQWRLQPVFEVLGTSTVDGLQSSDEGTIVELGGGFWWTPFADGRGLKNFDIAVGAKGPVTTRNDSNFTAIVIFDWSL